MSPEEFAVELSTFWRTIRCKFCQKDIQAGVEHYRESGKRSFWRMHIGCYREFLQNNLAKVKSDVEGGETE